MFLIFFHNQRTALHIAVREGQEYTVKSLVDQGADINIRDNDGVSYTGSRLVLLISLIEPHSLTDINYHNYLNSM